MIESPRHPADLLSELIRFDTTNPPGDEAACIAYLEELLRAGGLDTERFARDPGRPNLLARLPGRGAAPPLLLYGHIDVVRADPKNWAHPPFAGVREKGWVWGRGALDMKAGVAMMASAVLRAADAGQRPAGDVLLLCLADEEAGGRAGARYLVEEHPRLFDGVRYAIGEFGGIPLHIAGRRFYAIQVAEKQPCWMEVTIRGRAGHGARPMRGGAAAKLGRMLSALDRSRFPCHVTPVVRRMIRSASARIPGLGGWILRLLLVPGLAPPILRLLGESGRTLEPLFRNTANATIVRGGEKANVIPDEIHLGLDGRILPGLSLDAFLAELRAVIGADSELKILLHDPVPSDADYGLFDTLRHILRAIDSEAVAIPILLPASTDARFFSRLGIQTYGFTPMNLPPGFDFFSTIHGTDERIPVEAVEFGTMAIAKLISCYGAPET